MSGTANGRDLDLEVAFQTPALKAWQRLSAAPSHQHPEPACSASGRAGAWREKPAVLQLGLPRAARAGQGVAGRDPLRTQRAAVVTRLPGRGGGRTVRSSIA